ncbi:DUF1588 domain-containing protein [Gemmata sp.]|uniref:DUF1588 domain-containing protein n=1 Tax=Gemmata sp. TaxID=1914242 RepID=UPI003F727B99
MLRATFLFAALVAAGALLPAAEPPKPPAPAGAAAPAGSELVALVKAHCVRCHGPAKAAGGFRADDLPADLTRDKERWAAVRDQLRDGLMPPPKEPRVEDAKKRAAVAAITAGLGHPVPRLPNQGNLVPHELLFGRPAAAASVGPARVWRLSPGGYVGLAREVTRGRLPSLVQPFTLSAERGIRDFASLYTIDEPSAEVLIRNAEAIVDCQTAYDIKDGKFAPKQDSIRELTVLVDPNAAPTRAQVEAAVRTQYRLAIGRAPTDEEVGRFLGLYEKCLKLGDRPGAAKTVLQAVLLRTDALYRTELGRGPADATGRRRLAPDEVARAVSLALGHAREAGLVAAAAKGELATPEQVAAHVRRLLDDPKADRSRVLGFFREFFEYGNAPLVFKDRQRDLHHVPTQYVADTDRLILHVLAADKDVLRELLTTPVTFANYATGKNKQKGVEESKQAVVLNPNNNKGQKNVETVYGFEQWPAQQPAPVPADTRLGVLMQPSWLVAWSTNFDNDPVRRGRWVRERLLGGTVPDLPIGVDAQVPDDPHRTLRDRLTVTRDQRCWKCHQRMDELGLPFEQFDHFGRFRTAEPVVDPDATAKNVDKKGKPLGPVFKEAPLVTTGAVADSGDPALDGTARDPREFVRKLAASDRVRQVFVRHAFRYYLGRNEALSDARTLQAADRAYVASGGSFKALVAALLTSDSFLYRAPAEGASK